MFSPAYTCQIATVYLYTAYILQFYEVRCLHQDIDTYLIPSLFHFYLFLSCREFWVKWKILDKTIKKITIFFLHFIFLNRLQIDSEWIMVFSSPIDILGWVQICLNLLDLLKYIKITWILIQILFKTCKLGWTCICACNETLINEIDFVSIFQNNSDSFNSIFYAL